jgi:hypothetical protein
MVCGEQADKILGYEYNAICFNEIFPLGYAAVTTAYSRLGMRGAGCRNVCLYDCRAASCVGRIKSLSTRKLS